MPRIRNKHYKVDPALAIEAAFRQEVMGQKGVYFGNNIVSSETLTRMSGFPVFPLPPFDILEYYRPKV